MQKILLVRVGRVGDMVMITAAMQALFDVYPDAEFHLITSADGKRVLQNYHPNLVQIQIYNRKGLFAFLRKQSLARFIAQQDYSDIYCFEMGAGYLKLFSHSNAQLHRIENYSNEKNYVWHCLEVVRRVTGYKEQCWVNLHVSDAGKQATETILGQAGINKTDVVIGLHPSFSGLRKTGLRSKTSRHERGWPVANWAQLAARLDQYAKQQSKKIHIMMDLLEEDRDLGEQINLLAGGCIKVLIPPLNFERYKATLQRMQLLVTPNTGPMHIAGAVGTKMVALFAVESPDNCGPYIPATQYTALCAEAMPEPEQGLAAITVDEVFNACLACLK